MDHKSFDEKLNEKLGQTQAFPFDENQWEALEVQLDEKKEKRRPIVWWIWGCAASLLLLIGFGYYSFSLNQKIEHLEQKVERYSQKVEQQEQQLSTKVENEMLETEKEVIPPTAKVVEEEVKPKNNITNIKVKKKVAGPELVIVNQESKSTKIKSEISEEVAGNNLVEVPTSPLTPISNSKHTTELSPVKTELTPEKMLLPALEEFGTALNTLASKSAFLAEGDYPQFLPQKQKIKKPLRFKNIALHTITNFGWSVVNSSDIAVLGNSRLADSNEQLDLFPGLFEKDAAEISGQIIQYGLGANFEFTHGLGLTVELSERFLKLSDNLNWPSQEISNVQFAEGNAKGTGPKSSTIAQRQGVLGLGISYDIFSKWKVHPFVQIVPEFSWSVDSGSKYIVDADVEMFDSGLIGNNYERVYEYLTSGTFDYRKAHFGLRNVSSRIGVKGNLGKRFQWLLTGGMNLGVKNEVSLQLNRYQAGAGLNYKF